MPETVAFREDLQIIQVDSYGDVTADDLKTSLERVLEISRERGVTRVFVDATRERSLPSTLSVFEFGTEVARSVRPLRFAVARSRNVEADLVVLENVTRNRGAEVRTFDSEEAALAWLLDEAKPGETGDGE